MTASAPNIDERISALGQSIQELLERDQTNPDAEADIAEQLSRQNDELEGLAMKRDAKERALEELRSSQAAISKN